ncbi:hypothetical protein DFJ74DRAFT_162609 [Hyaloraphidium curvatum]|nr:hypothetical protein DFJ74DRAFT_162609 [Hyaloraphidium curvatum]
MPRTHDLVEGIGVNGIANNDVDMQSTRNRELEDFIRAVEGDGIDASANPDKVYGTGDVGDDSDDEDAVHSDEEDGDDEELHLPDDGLDNEDPSEPDQQGAEPPAPPKEPSPAEKRRQELRKKRAESVLGLQMRELRKDFRAGRAKFQKRQHLSRYELYQQIREGKIEFHRPDPILEVMKMGSNPSPTPFFKQNWLFFDPSMWDLVPGAPKTLPCPKCRSLSTR